MLAEPACGHSRETANREGGHLDNSVSPSDGVGGHAHLRHSAATAPDCKRQANASSSTFPSVSHAHMATVTQHTHVHTDTHWLKGKKTSFTFLSLLPFLLIYHPSLTYS